MSGMLKQYLPFVNFHQSSPMQNFKICINTDRNPSYIKQDYSGVVESYYSLHSLIVSSSPWCCETLGSAPTWKHRVSLQWKSLLKFYWMRLKVVRGVDTVEGVKHGIAR